MTSYNPPTLVVFWGDLFTPGAYVVKFAHASAKQPQGFVSGFQTNQECATYSMYASQQRPDTKRRLVGHSTVASFCSEGLV